MDSNQKEGEKGGETESVCSPRSPTNSFEVLSRGGPCATHAPLHPEIGDANILMSIHFEARSRTAANGEREREKYEFFLNNFLTESASTIGLSQHKLLFYVVSTAK